MIAIKAFLTDASSSNFNKTTYLDNAKEELTQHKPVAKPTYNTETVSKVKRIAIHIFKAVLSVVFFPYGIYRLLHLIGGYWIVPAQHDKNHHFYREKFFEALQGKKASLGNVEIFPDVNKTTGLIAKRISLMVDGKMIDAMILGKKEYLNNKAWTLVSSGNSTTIEEGLAFYSKDFIDKIDQLQTNILLYNYRGVGVSEGFPSRNNMVNTHNAMLRFLADQKNGIGAEKIIELGFSIGGGVGGHAGLVQPREKLDNVKRVCVKFETFSKVTRVPSPVLGFLMKMTGWEFNTKRASKKLEEREIPEIILQRAKELEGMKSDTILDDDVITPEASLARGLLKKGRKWTYKKFIGVEGKHCQGYTEKEGNALISAIKTALSPDFKGFANTA